MRSMPLRIVLALLATLPSATPAPRQIEVMFREADAIWRPHGVRVIRHGPGEMGAARGDIRLSVRFTTHTPPRAAGGGPDGPGARLGALSLVDGVPQDTVDIAAANLHATVAVVPWIGRPLFQWPPSVADQAHGRALGRVLAHELGHYLLAWPGHSATGLMRAAFNGAELAARERHAFHLETQYLPRLNARLTLLRNGTDTLAAERP